MDHDINTIFIDTHIYSYIYIDTGGKHGASYTSHLTAPAAWAGEGERGWRGTQDPVELFPCRASSGACVFVGRMQEEDQDPQCHIYSYTPTHIQVEYDADCGGLDPAIARAVLTEGALIFLAELVHHFQGDVAEVFL